MFYKKEREFYRKYGAYELRLNDMFNSLDDLHKARLPSDVQFCEDDWNRSVKRLKNLYTVNSVLGKFKRTVGW